MIIILNDHVDHQEDPFDAFLIDHPTLKLNYAINQLREPVTIFVHHNIMPLVVAAPQW